MVLPFSDANFQGFLDGEFRTRTPTGFADPRFRLAVNLTGSPPLAAQEFAEYRQETIVGASLQVIVPLGDYDSTKLINLGSNRWSFRPEVAVSQRFRRWFFEVAGGAWLFTRNDNFFGVQTLEQNPFYYIKGDIIYNFRLLPGLWLSFNAGWAKWGGDHGGRRLQGEPAAKHPTREHVEYPSDASEQPEGRLHERSHDASGHRLRHDQFGLSVHVGRQAGEVN